MPHNPAVAGFARAEVCQWCRLNGFEVHVGNVAGGDSTAAWGTDTKCGAEQDATTSETVQHVVDCGGKRGNHVHIVIPGRADHLTLCEVQVCTAAPTCGVSSGACIGQHDASAAHLSGALVDKTHYNYSGRDFVQFSHESGDFIEWTLAACTAGPVTLSFRYALPARGNRPLKVEVNGAVVASSLGFPSTGSWVSWGTVSVEASLGAGVNTVKLTAIGLSGGNVDSLEVVVGGTSPVLIATWACVTITPTASTSPVLIAVLR